MHIRNRASGLVWASGLAIGLFFFQGLSAQSAPGQPRYPIMHPDAETLRQRFDVFRRAPKAPLDPAIRQRLADAKQAGTPTSVDLLPLLSYVPAERNQRNCGDCWVWGSTAVAEIAFSANFGIKDRMSIQFLQSGMTSANACCGGGTEDFTSWYSTQKMMIPWSNTNASFKDGSRPCDSAQSSTSLSSIGTDPHYAFDRMLYQTITTQGVDQATAIANIKNILGQNKAVAFSFYLADDTDWNQFFSFWDKQAEATCGPPMPMWATRGTTARAVATKWRS